MSTSNLMIGKEENPPILSQKESSIEGLSLIRCHLIVYIIKHLPADVN